MLEESLQVRVSSVYLSQTDVPRQQQDEQQALADLRENDHQTPDRTVVPLSRHQPETREARNVDDHVALGHVSRADEVHSLLRCMYHGQEVLTSLCNTQVLKSAGRCPEPAFGFGTRADLRAAGSAAGAAGETAPTAG